MLTEVKPNKMNLTVGSNEEDTEREKTVDCKKGPARKQTKSEKKF